MNNPIQSHLFAPNSNIEEEFDDNQARVLPNVRLGNDVRIWESSIVYEFLYFMFEVEAIVGFMAKFLVVMTIFIEVPSRRYEIRHRCGDLEV